MVVVTSGTLSSITDRAKNHIPSHTPQIVCAAFRKQGRISRFLHFLKYTVIFTCSMKIVYEMEANEAENKLSSASISCPFIGD